MGTGIINRRLRAGISVMTLYAALVAVAAPSARAAGFTPASGSPFATAGATGALALGDLNGDGNADAVVADPGGNKLSVLLGDGHGAFTPSPVLPVSTGGTKPSAVALADMNADGKLDVVVANDSSKSVSVLLGDGAGTLAAAAKSPYATNGSRPASLSVGDFNGDSRLDVAVVHLSSGDVSVMLGDGKGAVARAQGSPVSTGGFHPGPAAAGDFNGDGKLDLMVANESGNVSFMRGDGTGRLSRSFATPYGLSPVAIGAGDLNGDGRLDVALVNATGKISILPGTGTGTLAPLPATAPPIAAGTGPYSLAVADVNLDGKLDLAVANGGSGDVSVLLGDGAAGFAAAPGTPVATGGVTPSSIAIGDLTSDGKPDVAVVNAGTGTLSILLNGVVPPSAAFVTYPAAPAVGEQVTFAYSSQGAIQSLDWDLNGDGVFEDAHGPTAAQAFGAAGTYTVSLRVTDLDGLVSTESRPIAVGAPVAAPAFAIGAPPVAAAVGLMTPFPIVRVTGHTARRGARIRTLVIVAPAGARVSVRCAGRGCPFRAWRRQTGSRRLVVRPLSGRFLKAGTALEVRVSKSHAIGKYTRLVIRRRKPPTRRDLCLTGLTSVGVQCPAT